MTHSEDCLRTPPRSGPCPCAKLVSAQDDNLRLRQRVQCQECELAELRQAASAQLARDPQRRAALKASIRARVRETGRLG